MASGNSVTNQELMAYVDKALDAKRQADVDVFLRKNPVIGTELNEYMQINQAFHRMFDPVLEERIPNRLLNFDKPKRRLFSLAQAASLLIAIMLGSVIGWMARGENLQLFWAPHSQTMVMVEDAFSYHAVYTPEVRHPVEVTRDQQTHLVKWLTKRLKTKVQVPNLSNLGFDLLGGRLLTTGDHPAAQFMYENAKGQRVTLFSRKREQSEAASAFRYASRDDINGFYWVDDELSFALIADIPKQRVSELAHYVYEDLNK